VVLAVERDFMQAALLTVLLLAAAPCEDCRRDLRRQHIGMTCECCPAQQCLPYAPLYPGGPSYNYRVLFDYPWRRMGSRSQVALGPHPAAPEVEPVEDQVDALSRYFRGPTPAAPRRSAATSARPAAR
jgi:hypothetical protein